MMPMRRFTPSPSVERNAEHAESNEESNVLTVCIVTLCLGLVNSPDNAGDEQNNIDNLTRVEKGIPNGLTKKS